MPLTDLAIVGMIAAGFVFFGLVLAYAERTTNRGA
jgi:hypothetical protein